jgi:tetratricopeptide (TPR) repeat protein
LRQLGSLDEAIVASRRAIALNAGLSVAHNNLGLCLCALGQREEGVASYRQALKLDPHYVDALNNLGNALVELGQRREALALLRQSVELDPRRAESHCSLGNLLAEVGRIDESAESFRRALALQPAYALAHLSLAAALRRQRFPAEAEASCRTALAIEPGNVEALCLLGELRADRGQFAAALELFNRAIAIRPDFAAAFCGVAAHRRMTDEDTAWLAGAQAALAKSPPLGQEIALRYALGKYFDDVGQYDSAFSNYRQANELTKRYGSSDNTAKLTQRVDEVLRNFDAAVIRRRRSATSDSETPVFIIGMPRSGTSLAEQILASHPAVFGGGELPFWDSAFAAYKKAELEDGAGEQLLPGIASDYLARVTATSGGALRVVDKMPANFLYAGLIHAAFPKARIIHMQRHPIDTCLSIYFQNFSAMGAYANDLDNLASYYSQYLRISEHWGAVLPASALMSIRYEALIEDLEGCARRMLDFIGIPWDPRCLDFHQTDRIVTTASKWQVRQEINFASAGRWRNYEKFSGPLRHLMSSSADSTNAHS